MNQAQRDRVNARWMARMAGVGAVVALAVLVGCDGGSDHLASEVEYIQTRLESMHTGGGVPAPAAVREKVYNETIQKVQELSGGATEAQQSTLALVMAHAKAGLAEIDADRARAKIAEVTRAGSLVRSALDLYSAQHALADSMLGYSPSEDLASLDDQTVLIEARMAEARKVLAANEQALAELEEEAASYEAQVMSERDQAARLRVEAISQPSQSRASMIERAKEHLLRAAEFERQRAETQIDIDRVAPVSEGARDEISRLQRQLDRLTVARTAVRDMDRALTQQSEAARRQAGEAATEVARRFETLVVLVDDEMIPAYDKAMSQLNAASGDAGRGRGAADRSMAQLTTGSIASSTAALAQAQSEAMHHLAGLMRELETVKPSLPGRARFTEARERYASLAESAGDVFASQTQRASSSFRGSGSGANREVFTSIAEFYGGQNADDQDGAMDAGDTDGVEPASDAGM